MTGTGCDVAIIGAGPAGLSAAATAAELGLAAVVIEEQAGPGGQVWRGFDGGPAATANPAAHAVLARARSAGAAFRFATTVVDIDRTLGVTWYDGLRLGRLQARAVIIATGTVERPLPFPGWTLPGVIGLGALQIAYKTGGVVPDADTGEVVVAGQGPLVLQCLADLAGGGARVSAVLDIGARGRMAAALASLPGALGARPGLLARGAGLLWKRRLSGVPTHRGVERFEALGTDHVEAVRFTIDGTTRTLPCRLLAVHDGVIPNTQLPRLLKLDHVWRPDTRCFTPTVDAHGRSSRDGVWIAGDGAGIGGVLDAEPGGRLAALDAARFLGRLDGDAFEQKAATDRRRRAGNRKARQFIDALDPPRDPATGLDDETIVCRCEGLTAGALRTVIRGGVDEPNRVKTATRCGMGSCQGRICGNLLTQLIARETGRPEEQIGALRIRPPLKPVPLGAFADFEDTP